MYAYFHPNRGYSGGISRQRNGHILPKKMFFLKLIFQDEGPLYGNYLFYFLAV